MIGCLKAKNPCKICLQPVTNKTGIQCEGACRKWVHFSCLDYTPGKIQDIKAGVIRITCPCPDCKNVTQREVVVKEPLSCDDLACPAKMPPKCEEFDCPANKASNPADMAGAGMAGFSGMSGMPGMGGSPGMGGPPGMGGLSGMGPQGMAGMQYGQPQYPYHMPPYTQQVMMPEQPMGPQMVTPSPMQTYGLSQFASGIRTNQAVDTMPQCKVVQTSSSNCLNGNRKKTVQAIPLVKIIDQKPQAGGGCNATCPGINIRTGYNRSEPSFSTVEQMCNTVGQLTNQINDLMLKMRTTVNQKGGTKKNYNNAPREEAKQQKKPCFCPGTSGKKGSNRS